MWFARVNYARGKGRNVGKSFSPFLYLSYDNLKLVGNMGKHFFNFFTFLTIIIIRRKYRKYRKDFRSDKGADAFLDLLSVVETTKKHNNSPYTAIRALF